MGGRHDRGTQGKVGKALNPEVAGLALFLVGGAGFSLWEALRPARPPGYPAGSHWAILGFVVCVFGSLQLGIQALAKPWLLDLEWLRSARAWPPAAKLALVAFGADLAGYWVHRTAHATGLWRVHRWHHSVRALNWVSGARLSLFQVLLFGIPGFAATLVAPELTLLTLVMFFHAQVANHANVSWRIPVLSWALVTPDAHRIHHSVDEVRQNRNFGSVWTFWDRLFGTFVDPRTIAREYPLGLRDAQATQVRMGLGL